MSTVMWGLPFDLPQLSLPELVQRLVAILVVIGVYGYAVAWWVSRLGDEGPTHDGRKTLNPLAHLDLLGLVHALFFWVVWLPRFDIDHEPLWRGRIGAFIATVGASAVLAGLSAVALSFRPLAFSLLEGSAALNVGALLGLVSDFAIVASVLNLLPLPPFVGAAWMPVTGQADRIWRSRGLRWTVVIFVLMASLTGVTGRLAATLREAWRHLLGF